MAWGKGETDAALRAARAVATRLRGRVGEGEGPEEQRLLSEVGWVGGWVGGRAGVRVGGSRRGWAGWLDRPGSSG